jgi:hypothetical protein
LKSPPWRRLQILIQRPGYFSLLARRLKRLWPELAKTVIA